MTDEFRCDSMATALRQAVANGTIAIPGAPNALAARLIERCGFSAVYLSGAAVSAASGCVVSAACRMESAIASSIVRTES